MAAPTMILVFASGLTLAVAMAGYGLLVLIDNRFAKGTSAASSTSAYEAGAATTISSTSHALPKK